MGAQAGIYAQSMLGVHTHASVGQGGQLDPGTSLNPQPKVDFGDGSDGDVTLGGVLTLIRDMSFNNLIIPDTFTLRSMGYKIKVKGKMTIAAIGYLFSGGATGGDGAAGVGGAGGNLSFYAATRLPRSCSPTAGGKGADAGAVGAVISAGGIAPDTYLDPNVPGLVEGRLWAGAGGGGGGSVGDGVQAGGVPLKVLQGAKGGNGANAIRIALSHTKGGGGGGSGGGLIEIWANEIDNNGWIYAAGGDGGVGEGDANAQAGGGGGGGGGAIIIFYRLASGGGLGIRTVTGGLGGASFGGVANGAPGVAGFSYAMQIGI